MIPTRMDLYDHQVFAKDPRLVKSAKASEFGRVPYLVENAKIVCCSPTAPWVSLVERSIFEGEYDEVVDELNKEATKILRETQIDLASTCRKGRRREGPPPPTPCHLEVPYYDNTIRILRLCHLPAPPQTTPPSASVPGLSLCFASRRFHPDLLHHPTLHDHLDVA